MLQVLCVDYQTCCVLCVVDRDKLIRWNQQLQQILVIPIVSENIYSLERFIFQTISDKSGNIFPRQNKQKIISLAGYGK